MESTNLINRSIIIQTSVIKLNLKDVLLDKKKYSIILIIFILFFISHLKKRNNSKMINDKEQIERIKILSEGKNYIEKCLKSLFPKKKFIKIKKPLISVIIPLYNCEETIIYAINSIQNQNLSELEIILINDFSSDNTTKIIKHFEKDDKRIKLITNNKNMGTLYSRCIGSLISKGKYIFALDNDDLFFNEDIFDFVYKKAIEGNFDIVGFKTVCVNDYHDEIENMVDDYFSNQTNNLILNQPKLGIHPIFRNKGYITNDVTIWGKCIKSDIYKKAVNSLGKKRYSTFLSWCEDSSIVFVIFNTAQSYKFINKYGILHIKKNTTASFTQTINNKIYGEIFFLDIIFDYLQNNIYKNSIVYYSIFVQNYYNLTKFRNTTNDIYLKSVIRKILTSIYITEENKKEIRKRFFEFI